jgi:hypothetical protein
MHDKEFTEFAAAVDITTPENQRALKWCEEPDLRRARAFEAQHQTHLQRLYDLPHVEGTYTAYNGFGNGWDGGVKFMAAVEAAEPLEAVAADLLVMSKHEFNQSGIRRHAKSTWTNRFIDTGTGTLVGLHYNTHHGLEMGSALLSKAMPAGFSLEFGPCPTCHHTPHHKHVWNHIDLDFFVTLLDALEPIRISHWNLGACITTSAPLGEPHA